jgi:cation diffusion facilitator family transporter
MPRIARGSLTTMHAETTHELGNEHDTALAAHQGERRTRIVIAITVVMMVVEIVVGQVTHSLALTADGWHMATHAGALGLTAFAYWFARTRARHGQFTFGTGKVYALAGYTSAILLAGVAVWMVIESVRRLAHPLPIGFGEALVVAVIGLIVNFVCMRLLHEPAADADHEHGSHAHSDQNLRAAYVHIVADALTSVLAIAALVGGRYLGIVVLDPLMGIVGAAVIIWWSLGLSRTAARQLLDAVTAPAIDARVRAALEAIDDVHVVDLHTWELGPARRGCVVSLFTSTPRATAFYREHILAAEKFAHLTVEVHRCEAGH